jgi:hypothetical protein
MRIFIIIFSVENINLLLVFTLNRFDIFSKRFKIKLMIILNACNYVINTYVQNFFSDILVQGFYIGVLELSIKSNCKYEVL